MDTTPTRYALTLGACLMGIAWIGLAQAQVSPATLRVVLAGAQCVAPVETAAAGIADLTYNPATRLLAWNVTFNGLAGPATMAHIHGPAAPDKNGPVAIWLNKQGSPPANPITGQATLTPEQAQQFAAGELYVNLHTQVHPACELRGQIIPPKG